MKEVGTCNAREVVSAKCQPLSADACDSGVEAQRILMARSATMESIKRVNLMIQGGTDRSDETMRLWRTLYEFRQLGNGCPPVLPLAHIRDAALDKSDSEYELQPLFAALNARLADEFASDARLELGRFLPSSDEDQVLCGNDMNVQTCDAPYPDFVELHARCHNWAFSMPPERDALLACLRPFVMRFSGVEVDELVKIWDTTESGCHKRIEALNDGRLGDVGGHILVSNGVCQLVPLSSGIVLAQVHDKVDLVYSDGSTSSDSAEQPEDSDNAFEPLSDSLLAQIRSFAHGRAGSPTNKSYFKWTVLRVVAGSASGVDIDAIVSRHYSDKTDVMAAVSALNSVSKTACIKGKFEVYVAVEGERLVLRSWPPPKREKKPREVPEKQRNPLWAEIVDCIRANSRSEVYLLVADVIDGAISPTLEDVGTAIEGRATASPREVIAYINNLLSAYGYKIALTDSENLSPRKISRRRDPSSLPPREFRISVLRSLGRKDIKSVVYVDIIKLFHKGAVVHISDIEEVVARHGKSDARKIMANLRTWHLKALGATMSIDDDGVVSIVAI